MSKHEHCYVFVFYYTPPELARAYFVHSCAFRTGSRRAFPANYRICPLVLVCLALPRLALARVQPCCVFPRTHQAVPISNMSRTMSFFWCQTNAVLRPSARQEKRPCHVRCFFAKCRAVLFMSSAPTASPTNQAIRRCLPYARKYAKGVGVRLTCVS